MEFKSINVGRIINSLLFKGMHLVAKNPLKLNNAINICLISQKIILYYS